jgi:ActR/RegA family two-component response regulator
MDLEGPGPRTILIVDYDLGFVAWAGRALTDAGYVVESAESVRHA